MDEKTLEQNLAEELIRGWSINTTGTGFLIITDWQWPNHDPIEIYVRSVGEREDLYLVSDGGEIFNFLFVHGIDLTRDEQGRRVFAGTAQHYGAKIVDYQISKGANNGDLHQAVRSILEVVKDVSFLLWHKLGQVSDGESTH